MANETALELDRKDVLVYGGVKLRKGTLSAGYNNADEEISVGDGAGTTTIMGYGIVDNEE